MEAIFRNARSWGEAFLALLYPQLCQVCQGNRAQPKEGFVCGHCQKRIRFVQHPYCERCGLPFEGEITETFCCANCGDQELEFQSARAVVLAEGVGLEILHQYKYRRALWFERLLGGLLAQTAGPELRSQEWDWLVPVPLYALKERERGFNQSERLAHYLSRATHIPMNNKLLRRIEPTRTQTQLSRSERAMNVKNAFGYAASKPLNGERIVLIDDVLTTGATTNSCAKVLRRNGSGPVIVWTVARGL